MRQRQPCAPLDSSACLDPYRVHLLPTLLTAFRPPSLRVVLFNTSESQAVCINLGDHLKHWLPGCRYIVVDTEQPSSPVHYFQPIAGYLRGAAAIWTPANVLTRALAALAPAVPAVALPVLLGALTDRRSHSGAHAQEDEPVCSDSDRVGFYGHMSLRRLAVLERLQRRGVAVWSVTDTYGDDNLASFFQRAKVVVAPMVVPGTPPLCTPVGCLRRKAPTCIGTQCPGLAEAQARRRFWASCALPKRSVMEWVWCTRAAPMDQLSPKRHCARHWVASSLRPMPGWRTQYVGLHR